MTAVLFMTLGISTILASYIALAASWYDLRATSRRFRIIHIMHTLQRSKQPTVAVIISADHSSQLLPQCLQALYKSHYHNFTVTVTTQQINPDIMQLVQSLQQRWPTRALTYYVPRRHQSQTVWFTRAYHRLSKHDFIFILEASDNVLPTTIKHAVARFRDDERLGTLQLSRRHVFTYSLTSLFVRYSELSHHLFQKAQPHLPRRSPSSLQTGMFYRHSYLNRQAHHRARRHHYESTPLLISQSPPFSLYYSHVTLLRWLVATLASTFFIVVFAVAATLSTSTPLLLSWLVICLWMIIATWSDVDIRLAEKIALSYGALVSPLLVFIQTSWLAIALPLGALSRRLRQWYRTCRNTYRDRYKRHILNNILAFKTWYEWMYPHEVWYQDQWRTDD